MKLTIALTVAALAFAGSAYAQQAPSPEMQAAREAMMKACAADMKSMCDGKEGREAFMCLRENQEKLSQPCKDARAKLRPPGAPPAGGR
jgi:cytochrome c556